MALSLTDATANGGLRSVAEVRSQAGFPAAGRARIQAAYQCLGLLGS